MRKSTIKSHKNPIKLINNRKLLCFYWCFDRWMFRVISGTNAFFCVIPPTKAFANGVIHHRHVSYIIRFGWIFIFSLGMFYGQDYPFDTVSNYFDPASRLADLKFLQGLRGYRSASTINYCNRAENNRWMDNEEHETEETHTDTKIVLIDNVKFIEKTRRINRRWWCQNKIINLRVALGRRPASALAAFFKINRSSLSNLNGTLWFCWLVPPKTRFYAIIIRLQYHSRKKS